MKALWLLVIIAAGSLAYGAFDQDKTWVHEESYQTDASQTLRVLFIQDKETGTRCYAVTRVDAFAIACVPQGAK